jgi:hypothetical protein
MLSGYEESRKRRLGDLLSVREHAFKVESICEKG